jgi:hypothetical protein
MEGQGGEDRQGCQSHLLLFPLMCSLSIHNMQLESIPFRILAATMKDEFRKPMPGMWYALEKTFEQDGVTVGTTSSYLPHSIV